MSRDEAQELAEKRLNITAERAVVNMARYHALLRLRKTLRARRADLCKTLAAEVNNLRELKAADATGDSADAAFEADSDVVSSQLAQLDSRELSRIERALAQSQQGKYGTCENCERKITLTRLDALPYATLCINCERQIEKQPGWQDRSGKGHWDQVIDSDAPRGDHEMKLSEMEMGLSGIRN